MPVTEIVTLTFDETLERGKCYLVTGNVSGMIAGESVQVKLGNNADDELVTTIVADGNFSLPFDYTTSDTFFESLILTMFSNVKTSIEYDFTDLAVKLDPECAQEYCSECFSLDNCGVQPTKEYLYLEWTNNDDGFGMNYTSVPLVHSLWVKGGLRNEDYPYQEDYFSTSGGSYFPVFVDSIKTIELIVERVPAYIHDALRLGVVHDEFTVNGVKYSKVDGSYSPNWDTPNSLLSPVIVKLRESFQNTKNENC